ncbi:MAG: GNAT family N-acetyltransferase [Clostridiales bacterium]|nr:GNAT family N-acetyltransferase [Clostridiales bacterium]
MIIRLQPYYETPRLWLILSHPGLTGPVTEYFCRNRQFLLETEPTHTEDFFTARYQEAELRAATEEAQKLSGLRFWLTKKETPERMIGMTALNNIIWGPFRSCFLSYRLDKDEINRGYMTEAVEKCMEIAFKELKLHRLEANIMPRNKPSRRVMEKLGFHYEGLARRYLHINGKWEDHMHMVKLNE